MLLPQHYTTSPFTTGVYPTEGAQRPGHQLMSAPNTNPFFNYPPFGGNPAGVKSPADQWRYQPTQPPSWNVSMAESVVPQQPNSQKNMQPHGGTASSYEHHPAMLHFPPTTSNHALATSVALTNAGNKTVGDEFLDFSTVIFDLSAFCKKTLSQNYNYIFKIC